MSRQGSRTSRSVPLAPPPNSRLPTSRPAAEGWPAAATAGCVWPGFQDGSARAVGRRVRAGAAPELRDRAWVAFGLTRLVRADLDGRGHRRLWEVVEATGGRSLLAEAKAGALGGTGDLADPGEFEVGESEVVGRARAGERLPEQPVLGLVRGELGRVARVRGVPGGRERRDPEQIRVDEQVLAGRDSLADRRQVERIALAAVEAVRDP